VRSDVRAEGPVTESARWTRTTPPESEVFREIARILGIGYLRLLATRESVARNSACSPSVVADPKHQKPLDVPAQQSDELGGQRPDRRSKCKPA
jgi:hypothetical protein